jgi:hypothetical protein
MSPIDPVIQYAARHLGGRAMPDDLRRLLNLQRRDTASGRSSRLKGAGVTFLEDNRMPGLVEAVCLGREDLEPVARLARAQAMVDMIRYSGFVAEDGDGAAIGYWFGPDRIPIEAAPLMRFDTDGHFSVLRGNGIAEAILVVASRGSNLSFIRLRQDLNENGFNIAAQTIQDVRQPECLVTPQATYRQLIRAYSADLSTASMPDPGDPVTIMTTHRGPDVAPDKTRQ